MRRVFRAFERKHVATAFTGEGARLFGGRWNSPGVGVVYASSSLALALLEIMANARRRIPPGFVFCTIDIPDDARVKTLDASTLPPLWYEAPAPPELQEIGDAWVRAGTSVALLVPSAIARIEENVLLNPEHEDFARLIIGAPQGIPVDERLRPTRGRRRGRR